MTTPKELWIVPSFRDIEEFKISRQFASNVKLDEEQVKYISEEHHLELVNNLSNDYSNTIDKFKEGHRCCGRCNGIDDICIYDRDDENPVLGYKTSLSHQMEYNTREQELEERLGECIMHIGELESHLESAVKIIEEFGNCEPYSLTEYEIDFITKVRELLKK